MSRRHKFYPFNAEQTVNILSEFGPLVAMFVVNAMYGINTGTWALITTTVIAIAAMFYMFGRPPVFPLIASTVTIVFGGLTLVTKDPMWVQIKVTIFNALFAAFLFVGLWLDRNFFKYVFEKTFHYTKEGWDSFTRSFAWFFLFTAVLNEAVRLNFKDDTVYSILGYAMNGINIWIAFKLLIVMPMSGFFAWLLTNSLRKHHLPEQEASLESGRSPAEAQDSVAKAAERRRAEQFGS
jgi:intracellular septation protein